MVSRLDICDISRNPMLSNASMMYPPMWRFLPIIDEQVSVAENFNEIPYISYTSVIRSTSFLINFLSISL